MDGKINKYFSLREQIEFLEVLGIDIEGLYLKNNL